MIVPDSRGSLRRVRSYFDLATQSDTDAYFTQFTDDAVVEDEGTERHGIAEIRRWRTEVPQVKYDVLSVADTDVGTDAGAEISGDFPGSPVTLQFHFEFTPDERIRELRIRG